MEKSRLQTTIKNIWLGLHEKNLHEKRNFPSVRTLMRVATNVSMFIVTLQQGGAAEDRLRETTRAGY